MDEDTQITYALLIALAILMMTSIVITGMRVYI